jgi:hypothetical protein
MPDAAAQRTVHAFGRTYVLVWLQLAPPAVHGRGRGPPKAKGRARAVLYPQCVVWEILCISVSEIHGAVVVPRSDRPAQRLGAAHGTALGVDGQRLSCRYVPEAAEFRLGCYCSSKCFASTNGASLPRPVAVAAARQADR